jgi:hypothetical protein
MTKALEVNDFDDTTWKRGQVPAPVVLVDHNQSIKGDKFPQK